MQDITIFGIIYNSSFQFSWQRQNQSTLAFTMVLFLLVDKALLGCLPCTRQQKVSAAYAPGPKASSSRVKTHIHNNFTCRSWSLTQLISCSRSDFKRRAECAYKHKAHQEQWNSLACTLHTKALLPVLKGSTHNRKLISQT